MVIGMWMVRVRNGTRHGYMDWGEDDGVQVRWRQMGIKMLKIDDRVGHFRVLDHMFLYVCLM